MKNPARQKDGEFRVVPHRPRRRAAMLALLLCVVAAVGALGYWYGFSRAKLDAEYLQALIRRDRASEERIAELRRALVDAELARAVDREAAQSLRETITDLREEIAELRDEAALYRNLLDPRGAGEGPSIADFELTPGEEPGQYRYFLLLTRANIEADPVRGTIELQIRGLTAEDGNRREQLLSLEDLGAPGQYPVPIRFRYFQGVSGVFTLPVDFEPVQVLVRLSVGGRREALRREFDWRLAAD